MNRRFIQAILASLLIILFVYAGLSKLLDFTTFKLQLEKSPFLASFYHLVAWIIPLFELIIAILLSNNTTRLKGFYCSFFLMLLFTGYIYSMLHFSNYVSCSCGGVLSKMSWSQHLVFNVIFTLIALTGILSYSEIIYKSESLNK